MMADKSSKSRKPRKPASVGQILGASAHESDRDAAQRTVRTLTDVRRRHDHLQHQGIEVLEILKDGGGGSLLEVAQRVARLARMGEAAKIALLGTPEFSSDDPDLDVDDAAQMVLRFMRDLRNTLGGRHDQHLQVQVADTVQELAKALQELASIRDALGVRDDVDLRETVERVASQRDTALTRLGELDGGLRLMRESQREESVPKFAIQLACSVVIEGDTVTLTAKTADPGVLNLTAAQLSRLRLVLP